MNSLRGSWFVVVLWAVAAMGGYASLPRLHDLSVTDPEEFFPAAARHRTSARAIERYFPGGSPITQIALIAEMPGPGEGYPSHREKIAALARAAERLPSARFVTRVISPTDDPAIEGRLVSSDRRAAIVLIQLSTGFGSEDGARVVAEAESAAARAAAPGFSVHLSGNAALGRDYDRAIDEGGKRSALATVILVAALLLLVYRSPVAAGLSIATLAAALGVTFGLVTLAAGAGLRVAYHARAFLVAIVYGVGTDYGLLLFARVREEVAAGSADPVGAALRGTRGVLVGSAAAVALACGLMQRAEFGLFGFSGFALAIGVTAALAAVLSLAPALLRLAGSRLFWPRRGAADTPSRLWPALARGVSAHPVVVILVVGSLLAPLVWTGISATPTYENEIDIPAGSASARGYAVLRSSFPLSSISPISLVVRTPEGETSPIGSWRDPGGLAAIHRLTERIARAPGVARVYSATRPTGVAGLFERGTMRDQLARIEEGLGHARRGAGDLARGLTAARAKVGEGIRGVLAKRAEIERERHGTLAGVFAAGRFASAVRDLDTFRADLEQLHSGIGRAAEGADALASGLTIGADRIRLLRTAPDAGGSLDRLVFAPEDLAGREGMDRVLARYTSIGGEAARFEIEGSAAPNAPESVARWEELAARIPLWLDDDGLAAMRTHWGGATPITADLALLTRRDLVRIGWMVTVGLFALLVIVLRDVVLSAAVTIYLLASYYAALGVLLVGVRAGYWPGLDWKAPFFLFVLLVAIGADYGVFLLGRAREEARTRGFREGLVRALAATGPVVTSCGLVLAGTFATLALAPIAFLEQVGLGVTIGVLIDTLLVRPFLLPATALLLRNGS